MKNKEKIALGLSFLVFLVPFLGIPNNFQDIVISVSGILIFIMIFCGNFFERCDVKDIESDSDIEEIEQKIPEFDESEPEVDIENEEALEDDVIDRTSNEEEAREER
ncbi:hypothetical protein GW764_03425 [Candidatus Parcubacteria bacterium]|nr:hypothetical protein [Candidatus Parcubacteria bacterium]